MKSILTILTLMALTISLNAQGAGNCLDFDGIDDYINLDDPIPNGDFTIEFWFSPTKTGTYTDPLIDMTEIGGSGGGRKYFFVEVRDNGIDFEFEDDVDRDIRLRANYNWNPGDWYHIAIVAGFNRSSSHHLYVNGVLQLSNTTNSTGKPTTFSPNMNVGDNISTYLVDNGEFQGRLDEFRIWSEERSQTEIRENMCQKLSGSEANLNLYYRLDAGSGALAVDLTGNEDGDLFNMAANDWVTSAAPIGDVSTFQYTSDWTGESFLLSSAQGDSLMIDNVSGSPEGMFIYAVNAAPNATIGIDGLGNNDVYYGVFHTNNSIEYRATYYYRENDAFQAYGVETELRLFTRSNNAVASWNQSTDTIDVTAKTIHTTANSTEFVMGSGGGINLPIELASFAATDYGTEVLLEWTTLSERDNERFEIEASDNGVSWAQIGEVAGMGSTIEQMDYFFSDYADFSGSRYYRLRQVDYDGSFEYSEIVVVEREAAIPSIGIVSEPVMRYIPIREAVEVAGLEASSIASAAIYQLDGSSLQIQLNETEEGIQISSGELNSGIYICLLETLNGPVTHKFYVR